MKTLIAAVAAATLSLAAHAQSTTPDAAPHKAHAMHKAHKAHAAKAHKTTHTAKHARHAAKKTA